MSISYKLGRSNFRTFSEGIEKEWLLTNGIGGFANQSIIGASNRIYSGYLVASFKPPMDRKMILSNTHETIVINGKEHELVAQEYIGQYREGQKYMNRFELDLVPTYTYQVEDVVLKKTVALEPGKNTVAICYEVINGSSEVQIHITPLFTYRNPGEVAEKSQLKFSIEQIDKKLQLVPEEDQNVKIDFFASEGEYYDRSLKPTSMATPNYLIEENQVYHIDNRTGFLGVDNHYTPYDVVITVKPFEKKAFYVTCSVEETNEKDGFTIVEDYKKRMQGYIDRVETNDSFVKRLVWSADQFIVDRESTQLKTILAGYPWFSDWGRDTMIALQGLTLSTKRYEDTRSILESFSNYVKNGMIPNVFPQNAGEEPMYNTIDASLWYFYSVYEYLKYTGEKEDYDFIENKIYPCLKQIIKAYETGTMYGISMDEDGLIKGGSDLDQLTWMDVRVGDWVVTPRHGKAVEVNALWYNALNIMSELATHYGEDNKEYEMLAKKTKQAFTDKFWNEELGCLYDVIEEKDGRIIKDSKIRPNQIYAVSLPYQLLDEEKEKKVVDVVYKYLYTPYGLRSLGREEKGYVSQYIGKLINRDAAYHMGTTWAYPMGAFISAFCKVNQHNQDAIKQAKEMCEYFEDHMQDGCLNQIAEIFDGDFASTSRGCYAQAWSVGEILRAYTEDVLPYM